MYEEKCFVRIGQAAEFIGTSKSTIRRWTDTGKIEFQRLPSGQRIVNIASYKEKNNTKDVTQKKSILYSRVSSHKQKDDLQRQKQYLEDKTKDSKEEYIHIQDIASGLNFKRPGLLRILELVKEGKIQRVVVASKDRLARFGFDLIQWLCHEYDTEILVLDNECSSPTEELGKDLLSIIQIYCCKWNGRRRYQKNKKNSETSIVSIKDTETDSRKLVECI